MVLGEVAFVLERPAERLHAFGRQAVGDCRKVVLGLVEAEKQHLPALDDRRAVVVQGRGEPGTEPVQDEPVGNDELAAAEHHGAFCKRHVFHAVGANRLRRKRRVAVASPGHQGTEWLFRARGGQRAERTAASVDAVPGVADDRGALAVGQPCRDNPLRPLRKGDVVAAGHHEKVAVREGERLQPVSHDAKVGGVVVENDRDVRRRVGGDVVLDEFRRAVR